MSRTAGEVGWHVSRYNLAARIPDSDKIAVANLFRGTCGAYTPIEMFLLDEVETLDENHPILGRFSERGLIVNFDELEALSAKGRIACAFNDAVTLTICPTMGCNFDCPYCFENHRPGRMSQQTQDDVVALAERMLKTSGAKKLEVAWFGGEPLLMPDVIESLSERLMALAGQYNAEYRAAIVTNGYLLTQEVADMLGRCEVKMAQITLDGIGPEHDKTRHLAGGGPTYDRIVQNLRELRLPFKVNIRHNVHEDNRDQIDPLSDQVKALAEESGNDIAYYAAPVRDNDAYFERNAPVGILGSGDLCEVDVRQEVKNFHSGKGAYCGANQLYSVGIDDHGRLFKCWEDVDKTQRSFGSASQWDPADAIATADIPAQLIQYLNTALPMNDAECNSCVFLPQCIGGCPTRRIYYEKACVGGKDAPERYVLGLYERLQKENQQSRQKMEKGE
ncbi:MAG: radical SAM protein [Clostridia bacterium]|nr:radical SAM protein [Clostridia bacterium]